MSPPNSTRGMLLASGSMDFDEFTDKMNELLKLAWGEDWGRFVQREPVGNTPEGIDLSRHGIIAFDTYERVRSKSHVSLKPILYDKKVPDPNNPNRFLELSRQWFDLTVDFYIYSQFNREARILMEDFEDFLLTYESHIKNLGLSEIIFLAELQPTVVTMWGQELPSRHLRYLVRIERIRINRSNNKLQRIDTDASLQGDPEDRDVESFLLRQSQAMREAYGDLIRRDE